jgi:hypothetical protein
MRKSVEWAINKYQKNLLAAAYSILKNKEMKDCNFIIFLEEQ